MKRRSQPPRPLHYESCARIRGGEPSADGVRANIVTRSRVEFKPSSSVGTYYHTHDTGMYVRII